MKRYIIDRFWGKEGLAKVYRCPEWAEYIVELHNHDGKVDHNKDYHTNDKSDALATAKCMVDGLPSGAGRGGK